MEISWSKVSVGDFVVVSKDEMICADMVVLATSNPDGSVFISTSSLDGEKTLKTKVLLSYKASIAET